MPNGIGPVPSVAAYSPQRHPLARRTLFGSSGGGLSRDSSWRLRRSRPSGLGEGVTVEGCVSGLNGTTGNRVGSQDPRGFKSLPFRQFVVPLMRGRDLNAAE